MRFVFVLQNNISGSAYMKGVLPSIGLQNSGIRSYSVVNESLDVDDIDENDVVIFVKYDLLKQAPLVKEKGAKVILDIVDSKGWKKHENNLDALIVNTRSQCEIIKNRDGFDRPILAVPHIMTNFTSDYLSQTRKPVIDEIKTVGYLGVSEQFTDMKVFNAYCQDNKMQWYTSQPDKHDNEKETLKLDLGCIYNFSETQRIVGSSTIAKPSGKLINMYSYGIPVLFSPYESYIEEISHSDFSDLLWCCCATPLAFFQKIEILKNNMNLYRELSDCAYEFSKRYHVSNTLNVYQDVIDLFK